MVVIVRTHSKMMAFPMVCPVLARLRVSPMMAYMLSLATLSPAPSRDSRRSSLICKQPQQPQMVVSVPHQVCQ